jgi:hypothetical protein
LNSQYALSQHPIPSRFRMQSVNTDLIPAASTYGSPRALAKPQMP